MLVTNIAKRIQCICIRTFFLLTINYIYIYIKQHSETRALTKTKLLEAIAAVYFSNANAF